MKAKVKKQAQARKLRKEGLSLSEISEEIAVSKSSVSLWCRDIDLSDGQKERLRSKIKRKAKKGRKKAIKNKREKKKKRIKKHYRKGSEKVGELSNRDKFIAGLMLYSGEGCKTEGKVEIANTDPDIITFMVDWFVEFFNKNPVDFRAELYIHDNLDVERAINFWIEKTNIPRDNFYDPYVVKNKPDKLHQNKHEFGTLKVGFSSCEIHREIMGAIDTVLNN